MTSVVKKRFVNSPHPHRLYTRRRAVRVQLRGSSWAFEKTPKGWIQQRGAVRKRAVPGVRQDEELGVGQSVKQPEGFIEGNEIVIASHHEDRDFDLLQLRRVEHDGREPELPILGDEGLPIGCAARCHFDVIRFPVRQHWGQVLRDLGRSVVLKPRGGLGRISTGEVGTGNREEVDEFGVKAGEEQRDVGAITVPHHVNWPDPELSDDGGGVLRHFSIGKRRRCIRTVAVSPLVDADDLAKGRKIIPLGTEAIVEKMQAAVQKEDRAAVAERFDIELRAPNGDEPPFGAGSARQAAGKRERRHQYAESKPKVLHGDAQKGNATGHRRY